MRTGVAACPSRHRRPDPDRACRTAEVKVELPTGRTTLSGAGRHAKISKTGGDGMDRPRTPAGYGGKAFVRAASILEPEAPPEAFIPSPFPGLAA